MQKTQETQIRSLGQEDPLGWETSIPVQYSCLENSMGRGSCRATVHGEVGQLDMTEQLTHTPLLVGMTCLASIHQTPSP